MVNTLLDRIKTIDYRLDVQSSMLYDLYDPRKDLYNSTTPLDYYQWAQKFIYELYVLDLYPSEKENERDMRRRLFTDTPAQSFKKALIRDCENVSQGFSFSEGYDLAMVEEAYFFFAKNPNGICVFLDNAEGGRFVFLRYDDYEFKGGKLIVNDFGGYRVEVDRGSFTYIDERARLAEQVENLFGYVPYFMFCEVKRGQRDFYPYSLAVDKSFQYYRTYSNVMYEQSRANTVKVQTAKSCGTCFGTKKDPQSGEICGTCGGSGTQAFSGYSQFEVIELADNYTGEQNPLQNRVPFAYVSPDTSFYQAKGEDLKLAEQMLKQSLYLQVRDSGQAETAEAKRLDKQEYADFINAIGGRLYDFAKWRLGIETRAVVNGGGGTSYELGDTSPLFSYSKYELTDRYDLIELISKAVDAGVNQNVINELQDKLVEGDMERKKMELAGITQPVKYDLKNIAALSVGGFIPTELLNLSLFNDYIMANLIAQIGRERFMFEPLEVLKTMMLDLARGISNGQAAT